MTTRLTALLWLTAYGAVQVWWLVTGPPAFGPLGTDLVLFAGPAAVGLCAAAALTAVAMLRSTGWRPQLFAAGCAASAALFLASPVLLVDIASGLMPGRGLPFDAAAFASRAACFTGGVLLAAATVAYRRAHGVRLDLRVPRTLALVGAWAAVLGCLTRIGAQVAVGPSTSGSALPFEIGFVLAGTVLPLALVHPWGRALPRWLLIGPAAVISIGLTTYFGISLAQLTVETATGRFDGGSLPLAFYWVAIPAYVVWGLGLGVAALRRHTEGRYTETPTPPLVCAP